MTVKDNHEAPSAAKPQAKVGEAESTAEAQGTQRFFHFKLFPPRPQRLRGELSKGRGNLARRQICLNMNH